MGGGVAQSDPTPHGFTTVSTVDTTSSRRAPPMDNDSINRLMDNDRDAAAAPSMGDAGAAAARPSSFGSGSSPGNSPGNRRKMNEFLLELAERLHALSGKPSSMADFILASGDLEE